jgi:hypothetical protein
MSAWSYTAPLFTEEKEAAERNALTEEERVTIENRIYGSSDAVVEETADLISASLSQFTEHLESIPVAEKLYYIEALERCPLVVQQESNALRFLRSVDFDAALASKRLVAYWEKRVEVFGSDRAFLPMTLDGAMKEDIQCFEEFGDANFLLPNDEVGRAVYFSDKGRSTTERLSKDQQLRMVWYYFHVAIEDEIVQKLGFVLVVNCRISKPNHFHRAYVRAKFQHLRDILPVKVQAFMIATLQNLLFNGSTLHSNS